MKIKEIKARKVLTTSGKPTLEIEINQKFHASCPAGTSKGKHEAIALPAERALNKFYIIKRIFKNQDFADISEVDQTLHLIDKSENFSEIGGNLALAISYAFLKFFAHQSGQQIYEYVAEIFKTKPKIPKPICNVAGGWKKQTNFQEFLFLPLSQQSFSQSIEKIAIAYHELAKAIAKKDKNFNYGRNLESGWVTSLGEEELLLLMKEIAQKHGLVIGLDVAATHFWDRDKKVYVYKQTERTKIEQLNYLQQIAKKYKIFYLEDPFEEEDFISFSLLTKALENKLVVGDDLYATNPKRLEYGLEMKATNGVIIKPNQIGTVSDAYKFFDLAKKNGIKTIFSHRSAETDDAIISHLAVGFGCDYVKFGLAGERIIKINEIIRIEEKFKYD